MTLLIRNVSPAGTVLQKTKTKKTKKSTALIIVCRCDRILWKTTIVVPPDPVAEDTESPEFQPRPRRRVGQFLVNAFRSPPARAAQDNNNTPRSSDSGDKTSTDRLPPTPVRRSIAPTAMHYHPSRKFGIIIVLS